MEHKDEALKPEEDLSRIVQELIDHMGFLAEVSVEKVLSQEEDTFFCNIKTSDSSYLIGQYGGNLESLQHLVRIIVRKKINYKVNFILDVNGYRREKDISITELAKSLAAQCTAEKRAIVMRPMSPYERRIVHLELSQHPEVRTESIGEGPDRRVVIKPADLI